MVARKSSLLGENSLLSGSLYREPTVKNRSKQKPINNSKKLDFFSETFQREDFAYFQLLIATFFELQRVEF